MDKTPSLSQYFGGPEPPPTAQFFDEIGTSSSDMVQSVYLGDSQAQETTTSSLYPQNMAAAFTQQSVPTEVVSTNVLPTVSGTTTLPATSLPDPSTFFDNIGPEPCLVPVTSHIEPAETFTQAIENLSVQAQGQQIDKEADRRRDAWIPNEEAKKTLIKAQSSPKGSFFPDREVQTMPGLLLEEELPDSLQEACVKYLGVGSVGSVLRAEHVSRSEAGLRELLRTGYWRAAINLTSTLIQQQGGGRLNRPSKHSARSLQLWLTRFSLLARLRMNDILTSEAEAFGDFSKPDMFYQFYPDAHNDRSGSLVPFSLRLLVAEIPTHCNKPELGLIRLYDMLAIIKKMLSNIAQGRTEDGTGVITSEQDRTESLRLWTGREIRVLHSIVNSAIASKDYRLAMKMLSFLTNYPDTTVTVKRALYSALCRLSTQIGHLPAARRYCELSSALRNQLCPTPDVREYVDLGLIDIALGKYQDAYNNFVKAADQEPTNIMVANNLSVCLLYMGRLKEAIAVLQKAINSDPERALAENLLVNLCTLYELESSKTHEKKLNLLRMMSKHKSDTIPNVLECLKLA